MRIVRPLIHLLVLGLVVFALYQFVIFPLLKVQARVIHMEDPDSLYVMENGAVKKVQLIGVDAPELAGPRHDIVQCYHAEARERAARSFDSDSSRSVVLEGDSGLGETDAHGRLLRYVRLDSGILLNELLLQEGLAREFHPEDKTYTRREQFEALARAARADGRGLWEGCGDIS